MDIVLGKCLIVCLFCHTRYAAVPMRMNRQVHTGAKTAFGGLKEGFARVTYQVFTELAVKNAPMEPMASGIKILRTKAIGLNLIENLLIRIRVGSDQHAKIII